MKALILVFLSGSAFATCNVASIPPVGCHNGQCVCDQNGNNCHVEVICR